MPVSLFSECRLIPYTDVPLLQPRDALFVATDQQKADLNSLIEANPRLEVLSGTRLKDKVPVLDVEKLTHAANDATGGDLDVDAIMQGFLKQLRNAGGTLKTSSRVNDITYSKGLWRLKTTSDEYQAPILVNAAGAWADQVAELAGLTGLDLSPMRRTALLVDPPPGIDVTDWPLVVDVREQFYFKPDAGQLLLSPADETHSEPCDAYPHEMDIALAVDRVQQVTDLKITKINHSWAGLRTFAPDRTFVTGFDPRTKGFFWLAGQGGYGVQTSPGLADIACCLITGSHNILRDEDVKKHLDEINPGRFLN